jgi:hypothetical protein
MQHDWPVFDSRPAGGSQARGFGPSLALLQPVELAPVREFVFVAFDVQLRDAGLQPLLHVGDGLVVDQRPDLLQGKRLGVAS